MSHARAAAPVETLTRTLPLPATGKGAPVVETPHARAYVLAPSESVPTDTEVIFTLPSSARFAYAPRADAAGTLHELTLDVMLRGNAFKPLHESPRALAAILSIAQSRRLETGPESERVFVFLRGSGLVFLENGDTHKYEPNTLAFVPAGEPARVWAQGPHDTLAIVLQPNVARAERRTLAGEIAKRQAQN